MIEKRIRSTDHITYNIRRYYMDTLNVYNMYTVYKSKYILYFSSI